MSVSDVTASNVVTLEALAESLPAWNYDDENHLHAVVDMGSNGIRFSIATMEPPMTRLLVPIFSSRAAVSLFDALTPSEKGLVFPTQTIDAVASALSGFHRIATMHGVPQTQIIILATEAMRRANNGARMLEAIATATDGLGVRILDPAVETLFGAVMGSRSGLVGVPNGALFLDLGGGSVQMTWLDTSKDKYEFDAATAGGSLPYGAARLTKVLQQQSADVQSQEISTLQDGIARIYGSLCARFPVLRAVKEAHDRGEDATVDVYMCGGGFRGYGSMLMHNDPISPYPIPSTSGYSVPASQFKQPVKMRQVNDEHQGKIYGMSKRRRQQFPAITLVIEAFIDVVPNIGRVTFCGGSNRQGALMMKMPPEMRESNPLRVLANVNASEAPLFHAIETTLRSSLPHLSPTFDAVPTVLMPGLASLFIRHIWDRCGYSKDSNSSFSLHYAIVRDPDCPGLDHLSRALLALTTCARWGKAIGPADEALFDGLRGIVDRQHGDASFWALYIGAVSCVLATVFPLFPRKPEQLASTIRFDPQLLKTKKGKDKVQLTISLSSQAAKDVNLQDLADMLKSATKTEKDVFKYKTSTVISTLC